MTPKPHEPYTVLVVEDDAINHKMICTMITMEGGYAVLSAFNANDAIHLAQEKQPDVILMDIRLNRSETNGEDAIRVLKADKTTQHIPIITVSAYALQGDKERFIAAGSDAYVSKPFRSRDLLPVIKQCIERSQTK